MPLRSLLVYVKEITGEEIKVVSDDDLVEINKYKNIVLIGDETTNLIVRNLVKAKDLKFLKVQPGAENFIIKSLTIGDKNYLILAGGTGRSTLYAVSSPVGPYIIKSNQETPYNRSQVYELVSKVYKKDVDAYLNLLRKHLEAKDTEFVSVNDPEFKARLNQHHREFLEQPLIIDKTFKGTPLDAVRSVYQVAEKIIPPISINIETAPLSGRRSQDEATVVVVIESTDPEFCGSVTLVNPMTGFISSPKEFKMDLHLGQWKAVLSFDVKVGAGRNLLFAIVTYGENQKIVRAEIINV